MRRHWIVAYAVLGAGLASCAIHPPAGTPERGPLPDVREPMSAAQRAKLETEYRRYLDCFNRQDIACFSSFYAEDLDYQCGDKWHLRGRTEFVAFYRNVWTHLREFLTLNEFAVEGTRLVPDVSNHIVVFADFPDFPLRPLAKGLDYVTSGKVAYTVRNGRFATIECL